MWRSTILVYYLLSCLLLHSTAVLAELFRVTSCNLLSLSTYSIQINCYRASRIATHIAMNFRRRGSMSIIPQTWFMYFSMFVGVNLCFYMKRSIALSEFLFWGNPVFTILSLFLTLHLVPPIHSFYLILHFVLPPHFLHLPLPLSPLSLKAKDKPRRKKERDSHDQIER